MINLLKSIFYEIINYVYKKKLKLVRRVALMQRYAYLESLKCNLKNIQWGKLSLQLLEKRVFFF